MRFFVTALVLMMTLQGCSTDDTSDSVTPVGDVAEEVQTDTVEEADVASDTLDSVDSAADVTTVEEED